MATRAETLAALQNTFEWVTLSVDYAEPVRVAAAHLQAIAYPQRTKDDTLVEAIGACRGPHSRPIVSLLCDFSAANC